MYSSHYAAGRLARCIIRLYLPNSHSADPAHARAQVGIKVPEVLDWMNVGIAAKGRAENGKSAGKVRCAHRMQDSSGSSGLLLSRPKHTTTTNNKRPPDFPLLPTCISLGGLSVLASRPLAVGGASVWRRTSIPHRPSFSHHHRARVSSLHLLALCNV